MIMRQQQQQKTMVMNRHRNNVASSINQSQTSNTNINIGKKRPFDDVFDMSELLSLTTAHKKQKTPKKIVRIVEEQNQVRTRPPMSDDDLKKCWYDCVNYAAFKMQTRHTVHVLAQVDFDVTYLDPNVYCLRGIEDYLTTDRIKLRKKTLKRGLKSVLHQQYRLQQFGIVDPSILEQVSAMNSKKSRALALKRGIMDATCTLPHWVV